MNNQTGLIDDLREEYHQKLQQSIWFFTTKPAPGTDGEVRDVPSNADSSSAVSIDLATRMLEGATGGRHPKKPGQTSGATFQTLTRDFLIAALSRLSHVRPATWKYDTERPITAYDQYEHLATVQRILDEHEELRTTFGADYLIKPDIVIGRRPLTDEEINAAGRFVQDNGPVARLTPLRASNTRGTPILHASVSCKWTIRSDRAQNARTEALNLLRNRKGKAPRIVVVTGEPLPTRLASLALGTGDLDCVYHMALYELQRATEAAANESQSEMLNTLVEGRRLRDISDLPFDLAV